MTKSTASFIIYGGTAEHRLLAERRRLEMAAVKLQAAFWRNGDALARLRSKSPRIRKP